MSERITCDLCQEVADLDELGLCEACAEAIMDARLEIEEGGDYE